MVEFLEQLLHDALWVALDRSERFRLTGSEITLGDSGRIDLLSETTDGRYVGFELKADTAYGEGNVVGLDLCKQLLGYAESGYLDELYYVAPDVSAFEELPAEIIAPGGREVYMGFGWSLYEPGFEEMPTYSTTPESAAAVHGVSTERFREWRRTIDDACAALEAALPAALVEGFEFADFKQKVAKHSKDQPADRHFDYDVLSLDETVDALCDGRVRVPHEVGTIEVPLQIGDKELPNYRQPLNMDSKRLFDGDPELSFTCRRSPAALSRTATPVIERDNEAWVQHHTWREYGMLREGIVPVGGGECRRIDVVGFEDAHHPIDALADGTDIVGIEAKNADLSESRESEIYGQLSDYHRSGVLSRVFLAVPATAEARALELLAHGPTECDDIGLLTVDTDGGVHIVREPARLPLRFDSYRTSGGYLRAAIYDRLKLRDEAEFSSTRE